MSDLNRSENTANRALPGGAIATGALREAEAWASVQCELFSGMGALWAEWAKRQREAIDASARSLQQMYECRNLTDLVQAQQRWFADTARRGFADLGNLASDAASLPWRVARVEPPKASEPVPGMRPPERPPAAAAGNNAPRREAAE